MGTTKKVTHDEITTQFGKHETLGKLRGVRAHLNVGKVLGVKQSYESLLRSEMMHGRDMLTSCAYKVEQFGTKMPQAFRDKTPLLIDFTTVMVTRDQVKGGQLTIAILGGN